MKDHNKAQTSPSQRRSDSNNVNATLSVKRKLKIILMRDRCSGDCEDGCEDVVPQAIQGTIWEKTKTAAASPQFEMSRQFFCVSQKVR